MTTKPCGRPTCPVLIVQQGRKRYEFNRRKFCSQRCSAIVAIAKIPKAELRARAIRKLVLHRKRQNDDYKAGYSAGWRAGLIRGMKRAATEWKASA